MVFNRNLGVHAPTLISISLDGGVSFLPSYSPATFSYLPLPTLASVIWELGGPAIVEAERLWDRVADKVGVGMTGARATAARAAAGVHRAYERHLEDFFMEWNPREEETSSLSSMTSSTAFS